MYLLAMRYFKGEEVEKDENKATRLFADSARLGFPQGQYTYGSILQQGLGTDKDILGAIRWHNLAISQGEPHSMLNLSSIYLLDRATEQKGIMLLRKAGYLGLAEAQVNWGVSVLLGAHGLQKNEEEAYKSFKSAAEQLFPIGLYWFGWMHLGMLPKYYSVAKAKFIWSIGAVISDDFILRLQKSLSTMDMFPGVDDAKSIIDDLSHENRPEFGEIDLNKLKLYLR